MKIEHTDFFARHPWPEGTFVQGSNEGLVFTGAGRTYMTAFVEVFNERHFPFLRGEGETVHAAEDAAWKSAQAILACGNDGGHEFEARGYKNGAGFCRKCNVFWSKVFTPEQLGLYCARCDTPALDARGYGDFELSFCEHHVPHRDRWMCQCGHPEYQGTRFRAEEDAESGDIGEEIADVLTRLANLGKDNDD